MQRVRDVGAKLLRLSVATPAHLVLLGPWVTRVSEETRALEESVARGDPTGQQAEMEDRALGACQALLGRMESTGCLAGTELLELRAQLARLEFRALSGRPGRKAKPDLKEVRERWVQQGRRVSVEKPGRSDRPDQRDRPDRPDYLEFKASEAIVVLPAPPAPWEFPVRKERRAPSARQELLAPPDQPA